MEMLNSQHAGVKQGNESMGTIAHYKLGDVLGNGTVGTVYRATDQLTDQSVAIKILLPQILDDSHIADRFHREMSILEKLDHPHIVHYLTGGTAGGRPYYVMELVDAGSLKDQLTIHGHLSWQRACLYGIQICSALQHAHNHGIIHRDLKPSNLFMAESGSLRLGDFGIARDTHQLDLTDVGLTVGTYAYMSPEQICADTSISDKTDLYALGCLLYEMTTGYPPFDGANFARIFDQHLNSDPPQLCEKVSDCPEELGALIIRLMAKHPAQRPFNARYVQGFLKDLLEQKSGRCTSQSQTSSALSKARPSGLSPYENHSWGTILGLLGLIGLILAATFFLRHFIF
jgi:serine/threonine protein kinase